MSGEAEPHAMSIGLIEVPYAVGDDRHAAGGGPARLLDAGAEQLIAALGIDVIRSRVERIGPLTRRTPR
jgi:hypothetical protein